MCNFCNKHIDSLDQLNFSIERGVAIIELLELTHNAGVDVSSGTLGNSLSVALQHLREAVKINHSLCGCDHHDKLRLVD